MATKITDNYFEYGNQKYFRGNAHLIEIGTYGEIKNPIGAKAYLDPQAKVKREHLDAVVKGKSVGIDWSQASRAAVEVNGQLKVFGVGVSAATSFGYQNAASARLKLLNCYLLEGPLTKLLNKSASGARKYLADEGRDGRIVSEVWLVLEAELAEHFDGSSSISIGANAAVAGLDITASGGKLRSQTITLAAGATFAYKLHKVKKWSKGKSDVEDMEADYYGSS